MVIASEIHRRDEPESNACRNLVASYEPRALRTYTPTQAVLARSSGVFHWTPENRRLYDFTSGVLVANLGHNPVSWTRRFWDYMGWSEFGSELATNKARKGYFSCLAMTAYNAVTSVETEACRRLIGLLQSRPGGKRLEQVLWAASGSEAIQKALWAALARDDGRGISLATRYGFHGKK